MAEWDTQRTQNASPERDCGFESHHQYGTPGIIRAAGPRPGYPHRVRISDLVSRRDGIHRRVGVVVPKERSAIGVGLDLYQNLGVDVITWEQEVFVWVGWAMAPAVQMLFERRTGIIAFNEWIQTEMSSVPG